MKTKKQTVRETFLGIRRLSRIADAAKVGFDQYCERYQIAVRAAKTTTDAQLRRVYSPAWKRRRDKMWETEQTHCDAFNRVLNAVSKL